MPKIVRVRELTEDERTTLERLSRSRTAPARQVERGRILYWSSEGQRVREIAGRLHLTENTVRCWINRFNEHGLAGIQDAPRRGRPATYTTEEVSLLVQTALTKPDELGLPFGHWTLDRLETYLKEQQGIALKRSRINEILLAEGLRWRKDEHWFGERGDPDFAKKRGSSPPSTRSRQSEAWSCTWMRWGRSRPNRSWANRWFMRCRVPKRTSWLNEPNRRSIMDVEPKALSLEPFNRPQEKP